MDKLQQAMALIKSGDKQSAQRLLAEVLTVEPYNEQAWLWMSAAVGKEKQRYCLEKVLSINPDNQAARQALSKMVQAAATPSVPPAGPVVSPPAPASRAVPPLVNAEPAEDVSLSSRETFEAFYSEPAAAQPAAYPSPAAAVPEPAAPLAVESAPRPDIASRVPLKYWLNPESHTLYVMVLRGNELIYGVAGSDQTKVIETRLVQGDVPFELIANEKIIPLSRINGIRLMLSTVRVSYTQDNSSQTVLMDCTDEAMGEAVVIAIEKRMGSLLKRIRKPMGGCLIAMIGLFLIGIVVAVTGFFYGGTLDVAPGVAGSDGVLVVGGILLGLVLLITTYLFVRPPMFTTLATADDETAPQGQPAARQSSKALAKASVQPSSKRPAKREK